MKIVRIEALHANGGPKTFSFLKVTTDDGLAGWSEFSEFIGSQGLTDVIRRLAEPLLGHDPRERNRLVALLRARVRVADGGLNAQACAAIENACIDVEARALGVPVHRLFGGALRDRLRVYWSHCGTYRARSPEALGVPPVRRLDDLVALGREVRDRGFGALKTNVLRFDGASPQGHSPGFGIGAGHPELALDPALLDAIVAQMSAFRDGAGPGVDIALDLNFNFRPEGYRRIARALEPLRLAWLEMDVYDARTLAGIRRSSSTPIGSMEAIYGRRNARPFFEHEAVDFAIIDPMWNGFTESVSIASLADGHGVSVNSHAFSSPLGLMMGAQLCAVCPNFHYVEMDVDQPPSTAALFAQPVSVEDGALVLPQRPGWGVDVDETAVRANPPTLAAAPRGFTIEAPRA